MICLEKSYCLVDFFWPLDFMGLVRGLLHVRQSGIVLSEWRDGIRRLVRLY